MEEDLRATIIEALQRSGVPLEHIAQKAGVHKSQVSRFKNGKFSRSSKNLAKVCKALQIRLNSATQDEELTSAVHAAWDGSLESKQKLLTILKMLKEWC